MAADGLGEHGDQPAEQRPDVLERPPLLGRQGDRLRAAEVRLEDEGRLRRPPTVDRLLADAGARRDALDRQRRIAALDEELLSCGDDRFMGPPAAAAPAQDPGLRVNLVWTPDGRVLHEPIGKPSAAVAALADGGPLEAAGRLLE